MNTETATLCCSYCGGSIASGHKFVIACKAIVLRLHPGCVAGLTRELNQWVYRGKQKSFALAREGQIALFMLSLLSLPPSGVLELAQGLDDWISNYCTEENALKGAKK